MQASFSSRLAWVLLVLLIMTTASTRVLAYSCSQAQSDLCAAGRQGDLCTCVESSLPDNQKAAGKRMCDRQVSQCCAAVSGGCPADDSLPSACSSGLSNQAASDCIAAGAGKRK
jgi:hypothetical protein